MEPQSVKYNSRQLGLCQKAASRRLVLVQPTTLATNGYPSSNSSSTVWFSTNRNKALKMDRSRSSVTRVMARAITSDRKERHASCSLVDAWTSLNEQYRKTGVQIRSEETVFSHKFHDISQRNPGSLRKLVDVGLNPCLSRTAFKW